MERVLAKQYLLTGYLEYLLELLDDTLGGGRLLNIITPCDAQQRGCQLSVEFAIALHDIHHKLEKRGVVVKHLIS